MLITVFKCYFPKRMIMTCKVQTTLLLQKPQTRYYISRSLLHM